MANISTYLSNKLLDHVLKTASYTVPTGIYIALSRANPQANGSGILEPVGNGYARILCNTWDVAVSRKTRNTNAITFAIATGTWGVISHVAIYDAITGGNLLAFGELSDYKTVINGNTFSFNASAIEIEFEAGGISTYLANELLDHVFKVGAYTVPTNIYAALTTIAVTDVMTGTTITETTSADYARLLHNVWHSSASGATDNDGEIHFDNGGVGATESWGTLIGYALLDAITVGNLLFYGVLDIARTIVIGDSPLFVDSSLNITLA
jgi:hypothetical protein